MKIKEIRAETIDITPRPKTKPRVAGIAHGGFITPMDRYPDLKARAGSVWQRAACIVKAEDGTRGFGLSLYGPPVASIINDQFAPLLEGQDCMATEKNWDAMNRTAARYSPAGLAAYAISAVDAALWDLKGKLLGQPVYSLLGGPQKEKIFCYASHTILDYGMETSLTWFLELGFKAVKVFVLHGPADGLDGLKKNEERVAKARELVGDNVELAVDC